MGVHAALQGQKTAGTREARTRVAGELVFFELCDEDTAGWRPASLAEPPGPHERTQRHTVEQLIEAFVRVPMLDVPVPLTVEQLPEVLQFFATFLSVVAEQVIDVPKIIFENIPTRIPPREPQLVEQLVEVPTVPFYVEQVVDNLDHQGSLPEQGPTLGLRLRGGLPGFLTGQGSTALLDAPQEYFQLFFFELFTSSKKSARVAAHSSAELGAHWTSSTMSAHQMAHLDAGTTWVDGNGDAWTMVNTCTAWER